MRTLLRIAAGCFPLRGSRARGTTTCAPTEIPPRCSARRRRGLAPPPGTPSYRAPRVRFPGSRASTLAQPPAAFLRPQHLCAPHPSKPYGFRPARGWEFHPFSQPQPTRFAVWTLSTSPKLDLFPTKIAVEREVLLLERRLGSRQPEFPPARDFSGCEAGQAALCQHPGHRMDSSSV